jgi:hypothetical protein
VGRGVPVLVGEGDAPGGLGAGGGAAEQVAGEPRVDGPEAGQLTGPVGQALPGGQRDGQVDVRGEPPGPGRGRAGTGDGAGVAAQEQVEVGAAAELVQVPGRPGGAELPGPPGDPLPRRDHLSRGQLASGQGGIPRVLGPLLHPRVTCRRLPPLLRLLRRDLHHRPADRLAQRPGGDPPGPPEHLGLRRAGLVLIQQRGGGGDDPRLGWADDPVEQGGPGAGQLAVHLVGQGGEPACGPTGFTQRVGDLIGKVVLVTRPGLPAGGRLLDDGPPAPQLGDGGQLAGVGMGLGAVPGAQHTDQLIIRGIPIAIIRPGRGVGQHRQIRGGWQHVQALPGPERRRPAGGLPGP